MKKISVLIALAGIFLFSLIASAPQAVAGDKTFTGKVIDADTKEPIEGAVVVAVWKTEWADPGATHVDLKDLKECLTDINGEWSIKGPKGLADEPFPGSSLFTPYLKEPQFVVFKPGYCSWPNGFSIDACRGRIKITGVVDEIIGDGGTLELPKLTKREDRLKALPSPIDKEGKRKKEFYKKQKMLLKLIDEERSALNLQEFQILKELENEK